jgi:hypothetical protein
MSQKTWTIEEEKELIKKYTEEENTDVEKLAEQFDKGYRSVISKLVQLGIYIKPEVIKKNKGDTVKLMLRELETMLDFEIEGTNLSKKENLVKLMTALRKKAYNG